MNTADLLPALRAGAGRLGLQLADGQFEQLCGYLTLLDKWGKVYNLTAVRDPSDMVTQHLLDCLAVIPALQRHRQSAGLAGLRVLDVGAGAGLPGVAIAICCPDVQVCCVDTVAKKAAFIQQVAVSLRLPNLRGVHDRVERLAGPFDLITARAFASLPDFVAWSGGALAAGHGVWMAMKGRLPADEIAALPGEVEVFHVEQLQIPGLDAARCLIWMRRRRPQP